MNDRPLQLAVATVVALAILLEPTSISAGSPPASETCPQCQPAPACSGSPSACRQLPRIIRYSYPSGALTVEGSSDRPDAGLAPDFPVAVRVCCVNPYRHSVNVKIVQTTFDELYKTPSEVTSGLLPSATPKTTKAPKEAPIAAEKAKQSQASVQKAQKDLADANTKLLNAEKALASAKIRPKKLGPGAKNAPSAEATKNMAQARAGVDSARAEVARAEAIVKELEAKARAAAQDELRAKLEDLNQDIDRLLIVDELPAAQRARVLQIDDPATLRIASLAAAFATAKVAFDPDRSSGRPQPCSQTDCSPEALIQLRAELAEDIEADFVELTDSIQKAKAADADRAKEVATKEKDAETAQVLADCAGPGNRTALRKRADEKRRIAAAAKAEAEAAKSMTAETAAAFAKAEKRHESLGATKALRDLQFASAMSVYHSVLDPAFGCLLFGPVAATGDEVEITVETPLAPEAANFTLSPEPAKSAAGGAGSTKPAQTKAPASQVSLIVPVVGRHRPSFSTGIFFTSLVNPTFFKDKNNDTAMNKKDNFTPALGAMVHTPIHSWRPDVSLQLSLGVALRDGNPIYALGPSVIIGRRQRTVFTAAIAGGQVNRLSGSDQLGKPVQDTQPKTDKVFRYGFLFGVTYNFGATPQSTPSGSSK